jgi:hypothetical protein
VWCEGKRRMRSTLVVALVLVLAVCATLVACDEGPKDKLRIGVIVCREIVIGKQLNRSLMMQ